MNTSLRFGARSLVAATGHGLAAFHAALDTQSSGLQPDGDSSAGWVGRVAGLEALAEPWPGAWTVWPSRATRLAWAGLLADDFHAQAAAACARWGADRVGLVLGTSASTIDASEAAYRQLTPDGAFASALRQPQCHTVHGITHFVQQALALQGPALTVSTACSSSSKALGHAARWLELGLVDAVVVGGVDALSDSLRYGFAALQLVSPEPCRPCSAERRGINIGEAAAFALLERSTGDEVAGLRLLAWGESNDAHHMSAPHPEGAGAEAALDAALARAGLAAAAIGVVHLHATATPKNDAVEAALVARRCPPHAQVFGSKHLTGHTMGAAGLLGVAAAAHALDRGRAPALSEPPDPAFGPVFAAQAQQRGAMWTAAAAPLAAVHAFGFGGNNTVVLLGSGGERPPAGGPATETGGPA